MAKREDFSHGLNADVDKAGDTLAESISKKAKIKTATVDMMDGTRIQEAIVKLLSSTAPKETTPIAEK